MHVKFNVTGRKNVFPPYHCSSSNTTTTTKPPHTREMRTSNGHRKKKIRNLQWIESTHTEKETFDRKFYTFFYVIGIITSINVLSVVCVCVCCVVGHRFTRHEAKSKKEKKKTKAKKPVNWYETTKLDYTVCDAGEVVTAYKCWGIWRNHGYC